MHTAGRNEEHTDKDKLKYNSLYFKQDRSGQVKLGQGRAGQGRTRQDKTRQDKTRQGKSHKWSLI